MGIAVVKRNEDISWTREPLSEPRVVFLSDEETIRSESPRLFTLEFRQDDPSKCTSAKMRKFGLARPLRNPRAISPEAIVLNPFAPATILRTDAGAALKRGLVVIDCSWVNASEVFKQQRFKRGNQRKLPALIAGNPTNYSKLWSLSSVEAASAALWIMNFYTASQRLLAIYKWGETFRSLNSSALEEYAKASDQEEMERLERSYFPWAFE
jgi:pre-rRNA-processing protein TSR3